MGLIWSQRMAGMWWRKGRLKHHILTFSGTEDFSCVLRGKIRKWFCTFGKWDHKFLKRNFLYSAVRASRSIAAESECEKASDWSHVKWFCIVYYDYQHPLCVALRTIKTSFVSRVFALTHNSRVKLSKGKADLKLFKKTSHCGLFSTLITANATLWLLQHIQIIQLLRTMWNNG